MRSVRKRRRAQMEDTSFAKQKMPNKKCIIIHAKQKMYHYSRDSQTKRVLNQKICTASKRESSTTHIPARSTGHFAIYAPFEFNFVHDISVLPVTIDGNQCCIIETIRKMPRQKVHRKLSVLKLDTVWLCHTIFKENTHGERWKVVPRAPFDLPPGPVFFWFSPRARSVFNSFLGPSR